MERRMYSFEKDESGAAKNKFEQQYSISQSMNFPTALSIQEEQQINSQTHIYSRKEMKMNFDEIEISQYCWNNILSNTCSLLYQKTLNL